MAADVTQMDVVFLLPGFLGFERFDDYAYFGERFGTALRASLMPRVVPQVQVVPVPLPPTSSLEERQLALGKTLVARAKAVATARGVEDLRAIHLVGHSTGGVDAHLLTLERPLKTRAWKDFDGVDVTWLRQRIRSVISIASPHQGTCLADDPLARLIAVDSPADLLQHPGQKFEAALGALQQVVRALPGLVQDDELPTLLAGAFGSRVAWEFVRDVVRSRALIDDLSPDVSFDRYARLGAALPVLRRSFVTVAGVTPNARRNAVQSAACRAPEPPKVRFETAILPPDPLFLLLAQLTSGRTTRCFARAPLRPGSVEALAAVRADPGRLVAADLQLLPPELDAALNDGVVNSARQMIDPFDRDEIAALVVADHFDVLGHYDRALFITDPKTGEEHEAGKTSGLLHSGSRFRDDQFFDLVERIATSMLPAFA